MKIIRTNLGPKDKRFNQQFPGFTQVLIEQEDEPTGHRFPFCQFYGPHAKLAAAQIISHHWADLEVVTG